ncbi:hypothetical protein VNO77_02354 [Canavalia gladiata]|uniref:Uncharacterized protein n=1 Tax=Canavalia gladiata TaxID=3824 RepID=A0AAN9R617_CANGL
MCSVVDRLTQWVWFECSDTIVDNRGEWLPIDLSNPQGKKISRSRTWKNLSLHGWMRHHEKRHVRQYVTGLHQTKTLISGSALALFKLSVNVLSHGLEKKILDNLPLHGLERGLNKLDKEGYTNAIGNKGREKPCKQHCSQKEAMALRSELTDVKADLGLSEFCTRMRRMHGICNTRSLALSGPPILLHMELWELINHMTTIATTNKHLYLVIVLASEVLYARGKGMVGHNQLVAQHCELGKEGEKVLEQPDQRSDVDY